jgi:AraC family transcriptional regulator, regulatory protein of adaptative response / methylated-DNA-[protein]-cysteine methyltransferase
MIDRMNTQPPMPSEGIMRKAVSERDRHFDGSFVYGVITTGVYCHPSCKSRRAKAANIRFFAGPEAAESAGFRACKRCQPRGDATSTAKLMQSLAKFIDKNADQPLSLERLSEQAHLSPTHLQRTFKTALGVSPKAYHDAARLRLLKNSLKAGKPVIDSIEDAGFQSTSRIYGHTTRNLGMAPSVYRAGGLGETIAYAYRDTAMGALVMAATDTGVCFAQFGPSESALVAQLKGEFPQANVTASTMTQSPELNAWIEALEAHIAASAPRPDVPLDLRGTAFQIQVWKFLLGVPSGSVVSYGEVAQGIGAPKAFRAAASACAANRIAVLVPCHRVLRGNGDLGGYRWGLERKRALLDRERTPKGGR